MSTATTTAQQGAIQGAIQGARQGVYFLANDRVLNWAIAFFESFRAHNPDLPLVMIPFDEKADQIRALATRYRFEIFEDPILEKLDQIGARFYPDKHVAIHTFRKFAVFFGPLERFIFSDVDLVLLESVDEFLAAYERSGMELLHTDEEIHQVYSDPKFREEMIRQYGAHGFNAGFWGSRRGLFSLDEIAALAESAMAIKEGLNPGTYEQPFLNYCCDVKPVRYAHFAQFIPDLSRRFLSIQEGIRQEADGVYRIHQSGSPDNGKRVKYIHWAGTGANEGMPYRAIFLSYRLRPRVVDDTDKMDDKKHPAVLHVDTNWLGPPHWARVTDVQAVDSPADS